VVCVCVCVCTFVCHNEKSFRPRKRSCRELINKIITIFGLKVLYSVQYFENTVEQIYWDVGAVFLSTVISR